MITKKNIFNHIAHLLFIVVFMSMSFQNSITTLDLFVDIDSELVEVDWEEEADDEDNKEKEEVKNEKIELEYIYKLNFYTYNTIKNIFIQAPFWEFNFDIHTPPPDLV